MEKNARQIDLISLEAYKWGSLNFQQLVAILGFLIKKSFFLFNYGNKLDQNQEEAFPGSHFEKKSWKR